MILTKEQISVLKHTAKNNFYCGEDSDVQILCSEGLMEYAGRKSFVPDSYFKLTCKGKDFLNTIGE